MTLWQQQILQQLFDLGYQGTWEQGHTLGGGCIASVGRWGDFVVKRMPQHPYPGMLAAEADGLRCLSQTQTLPVAPVLQSGSTDEQQWMILPFLPSRSVSVKDWENWGRCLAALHRCKSPAAEKPFGYGRGNWLATLAQTNTWCEHWGDFWWKHRLEPWWKIARDQGDWGQDLDRALERLEHKRHQLFPKEPAALLHGDLWSGNVHRSDQLYLIDPAVYWGHREIDLGMMLLFGGFPAACWKAYQEVYPLEPGWHERVSLAQIIPLLVHVILFGGGYVNQLRQALHDSGLL